MQIQDDPQSDSLRVDVENGIATITIDRPRRKNAMTQAMWQRLPGIIDDLTASASSRAIILTGSGADFCAGADIAEFDDVRGDAAKARVYEAYNSAAFAAVRNSTLPVVAAIRGICFGGGFGLAAACDLRLATPDAAFSVPAAKLGLAYPVDAMADIVNAVGPQVARYLAYSAARLDAAAALRAGFLMEVVSGDLDARVGEIAATIARNAPLSIRASKASIQAVLTGAPGDAALAGEFGDRTFESVDYAEGRAAFREKRPPVFRGI
ncbi:enoyl-CoA hydratase-related protein [Mesorhizobium sp. CAU 1732]|uniref:enoyl-CoA hydratase-related protein n=1 Tax=Mesorhizobium sp. CAU 1732 TaxID=3140358 RepID=UPI00326194E5